VALEMLEDRAATEAYRRAAELWRPLAEAQAEDVAARLGLARALAQAGDWAGAEPLVKGLAEGHPDLWWPHFALAHHTAGALFGLLGARYSDAAAPPNPDDPQAVAAWSKQFPAEYVSVILDALRKAPEDPGAVVLLAEQLGAQALADLDRARQAAPDELAPQVLTFLIHWQLGMRSADEKGEQGAFDAAHAELLQLAEAHPDIPRLRLFANFQSVLGAMVRGQVEDFIGVWNRLTPQDRERLTADEAATRALLQTDAGRTPDAYELAALYQLLRGDVEAALTTLRESTEHDPASRERWEAYIGVLTQGSDLGAVKAAIEQALQHADNGTLRCALAKVYQKQGDRAAAEAQLEAAIALHDDRAAFARVMLGLLRLKADNAAGAIAPLEAAAVESRENGLCEAALGIALALAGREAEAPAHIAEALKLSPHDRLFAHAAGIIGQ